MSRSIMLACFALAPSARADVQLIAPATAPTTVAADVVDKNDL